MLSRVMFRVTGFSAGCRGIKDIPQQWSTEAPQLTWPYMNWDLYSAVIFSTYFVSTERGQRSETRGAGSLAIEASMGNWPYPNPDLTCAYMRLFYLMQLATEAETELSASPTSRVRGGQRSCRWAQESAGSPRKGQCGEGGAWHQCSPIMPFHSQDTRLCKALFQHCNLD